MTFTAFRLLREPSTPGTGAGVEGTILPLAANTASVLVTNGEGQVTVAPDGGAGTQGDVLLNLEPVQRSTRQELLAVVPAGLAASRRPRLGGRPLPQVAVLHVGDVLTLADGSLLHLTIHREMRVSAPPETVVAEPFWSAPPLRGSNHRTSKAPPAPERLRLVVPPFLR